MEQRDKIRSPKRERVNFPPISPGRTSLSTSTETVMQERPVSGIHGHSAGPPLAESMKRQRPTSGRSSCSLGEEIKRQRPDSGQNLTEQAEAMIMTGRKCIAAELGDKAVRSSSKMDTLQKQSIREEERLKSLSVQQFSNEVEPTPNLSSNSSESANRPPTPAVIDLKAERRRKRREKKEREARKLEDERKKEQNKLEGELKVAELSRNRSMFNGNRETLPAIGRKTAEVNFYMGKLPKIQEYEITGQHLSHNNAVDVIKKHETQVRTTAFLRKISEDYINASAELMEPYNVNGAIDIIEKHEEEVGRKHAMYTGSCYPAGSGTNLSAGKQASARSRCSSGVSRRTAA